jgi:hypothetical protein
VKKKIVYAVLAASGLLAALVGCQIEEAEPAADAPKPDPVIGPGPVTVGPDAGSVPAFDLPDTSAPAPVPVPVGDAGASVDASIDVQPVENDPGAALGARVWGTDEDGRLVSFRVNEPGTVAVKLVSGLAAGEKILSIDFRPANGGMYALGSTSRVYTIDRATGAATVVGDGAAFTPAVSGQAHGFDFNPVADQIRVHTDVDQNLRLDPITGKVTLLDGPLRFAPADVNVGQSPNLVATAYTNSVSPAPTTTMLYALDSTRDLLTRLPAPNDGLVETIGALGVDVEQVGGFDISRQGVPYAALRVGAESALYTIDLATGVATKVGVIGYPAGLTSIAVEP